MEGEGNQVGSHCYHWSPAREMPQGPRPVSLKGAAVLHPLPLVEPWPLGQSVQCLGSGDLPS